jgi:chloramphenicol-sensitive protein RarD
LTDVSGSSLQRGVWQGVAAYTIWGLFPIYWKLFQGIPALEVLAHRVTWSFVAVTLMLLAAGRIRLLLSAAQSHKLVALYGLAAVLIGINWFLYVWGVNAGFVVETSLGYFITPLINVLLGVVVFRERLSVAQWAAVALAAGGVMYLTFQYGSVPWLALGLAVTFGSYGLTKKKAPLGAFDGLALETAILVAPAVAYLAFLVLADRSSFVRVGAVTDALLIGGGLITIAPLLLFASAVRAVPLSIVGLLQYISPTIQLVLGVLLFREPFTRVQLTGFGCVWAALVMFAFDSLRASRSRTVTAAVAPRSST